jgi:hypothetical protein
MDPNGMITSSTGTTREIVEGRILSALAPYGGQRIIAGPKMKSLIKDLADLYERLKSDGM